ncbi:MAG TPA: ABC transporter permease [Bryobacteraceae bacterium]|jgi:predicted permease|nr:ABC transporter permease [Bryobacteraceae bacterium]
MTPTLRITCRTLAKSPAFSLTAIAALALGIGANTAIFSVVNQVLLNPAGVSNPERVASLRVKYDKLALKSIGVSVPDFSDVQKTAQLFESGAILGQGDYNYTGSGMPERLQGATVSLQWFDVFGAKPRLGRLFQPEEDHPKANQVVILSYAAWKRLFGQDPSVLGRTIELNRLPYRVIGVMGPEFRWPAATDLWVPLGLPSDAYNGGNRFNESYNGMVRLKPGVTFQQANAYVQILSNRVRNDGTGYGAYAKDSEWGMFLVPFTDFVAGDTKTPMLVLLASVGFVLLIACSNIAGLMLARASGRSREIAVRAALGASRWNLIRQTMAESLILSFAGAIIGLALSFAGVRGLLALAPENSSVALDVRMDPTVLLFTAFAAIAAGILFGIAPAWQISRLDRFDALREGGRSGSAGLRRQKLRSGLVIGEVALALVLLVGAGLFLRSLASLQDVNPGFQPQGLISGSVTLPDAQYGDAAKQIAFYNTVLDRLSTLPGVSNVAAAVPLPFTGQSGSASFSIEGRPSPPGDPGPHGDIGFVSPGYFATLRIPVKSGRVFTDQDRSNTTQVALIDETLAREYWPNQDPIGQHMRNGGSKTPWATIVGVVGHTKNSDLAGDVVKGRYYYPLLQQSFAFPFTSFIARTDADPALLTSPLREAVRAVDPSLAVSRIKLMSDLVSASLAPRRFVVTLLGIFAGLALLMAVIGLYGVISYSVTQRTQEIGIRMALGAQASEVLGLVIGQGMLLAGIGAAIGLMASLAFSRLLKNQLFQVSAFDPLTFLITALVLITAALLATYIPARRATRVDPMEALRHE